MLSVDGSDFIALTPKKVSAGSPMVKYTVLYFISCVKVFGCIDNWTPSALPIFLHAQYQVNIIKVTLK